MTDDGDKDEHGGETTDGEGVWSEVEDGPERQFIQFAATSDVMHQPCIGLSSNGLNTCIYNGNKPWVCKVWPTIPSDIKLFPNCSYEFEVEGQWDIDDIEDVTED